jgi:hypothetical protein
MVGCLCVRLLWGEGVCLKSAFWVRAYEAKGGRLNFECFEGLISLSEAACIYELV